MVSCTTQEYQGSGLELKWVWVQDPDQDKTNSHDDKVQ